MSTPTSSTASTPAGSSRAVARCLLADSYCCPTSRTELCSRSRVSVDSPPTARPGFRGSQINFTNTTSGAIDFWLDIPSGDPFHRVVPSSGANARGEPPKTAEASTVTLGFGDDPGARRTATVDVFLTQAGVAMPEWCVFQAQAMLWTVDE